VCNYCLVARFTRFDHKTTHTVDHHFNIDQLSHCTKYGQGKYLKWHLEDPKLVSNGFVTAAAISYMNLCHQKEGQDNQIALILRDTVYNQPWTRSTLSFQLTSYKNTPADKAISSSGTKYLISMGGLGFSPMLKFSTSAESSNDVWILSYFNREDAACMPLDAADR
jgi:hypothetical protein